MGELIRKITEHAADAAELVAALDDVCILDSDGRSLFDIAIASDNQAVIEVLAQNKQALSFSAPIDDATKTPVKQSAQHHGIEYPITNIEHYLAQSFGPDLSYGRTPLLAACRANNQNAIQVLLKAGAKATDKDLLGLTAPDLCFYSAGTEGLRGFIEAYKASGQKKLTISPDLLRELLPFPDLLETVKTVAKLGIPAQQLLFCYDCARLNLESIKQHLASGFELNKAIKARLNPVKQACASDLFWEDRLPDSDYFAYHLIKYYGPAGSHAIHIDNNRINANGSSLSSLMAEAERERKRLINEAKKLTLSDAAVKEQVAKRCALIDVLVDAGLDIELAQDKLDDDFVYQLEEMGLKPVVDHLKRRGFFAAESGEPDSQPISDIAWELAAESTLTASLFDVSDDEQLVQLVYQNGYGPVNGVHIKLRVLDDDGKVMSDWTDLTCSRELIDIDGDLMARDEVEEPLLDEAPWQAFYTHTLETDLDMSRIEIAVQSDAEAISAVLSDWTIEW